MSKEDNQSNSLGLSDDDFSKIPPPEFDETELIENTDPEETDSDTENSLEDSDNSEASEDNNSSQDIEDDSTAQEQPEKDSNDEEVGQPDRDTSKEHENSSKDDDSATLDTGKSKEKSKKDNTSLDKDFDYKSAFEEVTKPFKANGVEMQVKDPQDIVRLMQMGVNYQKKMQHLKPSLKAVKMLEQNNLIGDEDQLNFLIDLSKKDPKAIARLVKESNIDPLDIDTEGAKDYRAKDYTLSDNEYALDEVLEEIKESPSFDRTINVLSKEWDEKSRTVATENPDIIRVVNVHMDNGIFDKVNGIILRERALGKLKGVSDVDAYTQTLDNLIADGALVKESSTSDTAAPSTPKVPESSKSSKADAERKKKRKAAAPNKATKLSVTEDMEKDLLNLPDDDFMAKYSVR